MPLGVLTDAEANSELSRFGISCDVPKIEVIHQEIKRGRGAKEEVPVSVRAFIASESISGASPEVLSREFNISKSSISAYKNGATSTASYNNPNPVLESMNDNVRATIIGPAQSRILKAILSITDDKLDGSKAKEAAAIAASLSTVIRNVTPDKDVDNRTQINIFAPRKNEEEDYEIVRVD